MFALQRHNPAKIVQTQNGRFSSMPKKHDHGTGESVVVLNDIGLQNVIGHLKRLVCRIKLVLLQVVTIMAIQVTNGASRLGKNLKFTGSFNHGPIPQSPG
jgi:hypothetical protein